MSVILASGSAARHYILQNLGIIFDTMPADIDEGALIAQNLSNGLSIADITQKLADAKALHMSARYPNSLIIGSDQTLDFKGNILNKAKTKQDASEKLRSLRGETHTLRSAVSVVLGGRVIFNDQDEAHLTMHDFDDDFLSDYMERDPDALTSCVGGYKIEGAGAALFSSISGHQHTIMGMPSERLIDFLRQQDTIAL